MTVIKVGGRDDNIGYLGCRRGWIISRRDDTVIRAIVITPVKDALGPVSGQGAFRIAQINHHPIQTDAIGAANRVLVTILIKDQGADLCGGSQIDDYGRPAEDIAVLRIG